MAETFIKNELYNPTERNLKKLLEVAYSSEICGGERLETSSYMVPQLFRDCSEGNYENVKEHIINQCDVNEIGPDGETALACAINANNFQIVELLLKSGANPNNRPDKIESTPLMDASNVGFTDIVRILLEYGANPDVKSSTNNTALHYAACGGHIECCKLILDYSSNAQTLLEEQNENGHTALMEASTSGFIETTRYLVEIGAQINTPSAEFKETALTLASYKGYSDIVQYLLQAGADHEHRTDEMHTALMECSMEGHIDTARVLLHHGAQVNMRMDSFESPLTLAACSGHSELAAHLISYGADIEEVNDESYTPLMEASREGHLETVAMLLALGARINRLTEETQETALTLASCGGYLDIVLLLERCGADIELGASTALMESSQEGHVDIVKSLLAMGAKVEARNSNDETSLHLAAESGHVEVCRHLLEYNADIHHLSEGGTTCLMKACRAGRPEVVVLLVENGAKVDQLTTLGDHNALSLACASGHCKIVEYLLQVGADPTVKLKDNCTVLIEASRAGHLDVIEILLRDNRRDQRLLVASSQHPSAHIFSTEGGLDNDHLNGIHQLNNVHHDMYDMNNKLMNIYTEHNHRHNHLSSQFHPCAFSQSLVNNDVDNVTFPRPFVFPSDIPDPPLNPPPSIVSNSLSLYPCSQQEQPMSIFGADNDKLLLQNMLDPNSSPNIEELVKYIYPSFNNNLYFTTENNNINNCVTTPITSNGHFHRKIKKAKHSENYNVQSQCVHSCLQQRPSSSSLSSSSLATNNFFVDKSSSCKFHRCPAEGANDSGGEVKRANKGEELNMLMAANNECDNDLNHVCEDCNKFHLTNTPKDNPPNVFTYPTKKNLFSATNNSSLPVNKKISTSLVDSGVFSLDKNNQSNINSIQNITASLIQDEYYQAAEAKHRIFNSVTPTNSISPLKPKINNQASSTPFQKQVLQPKRRLQQNQRSPMSANSSLSTSSSLCSEHKIILSSQSESFILPSSSINNESHVFDTSAYLSQDSSNNMSYNNFNFPEKNLSCEERDLFFQQSLLGDLSSCSSSSSSTSISASNIHCTPLHLRPILTSDCTSSISNTKHSLLSSHLEQMTPKRNIVDNCNITVDNGDNLEAVEEIDKEVDDDEDEEDDDGEGDEEDEEEEEEDDDFESDIEVVSRCAAAAAAVPPYNNNSNKSHINNKQGGECCKNKKLNVNVCTESLNESPLSLACSGGHIEVVKLLINSGAKLEHRDKKSQSALHVAVLNGHLEVVKFLLESGADLEAMVDRTKDTALSLACANGRLEICEELVNKGANIEHRNISDYTPLSLAASGGYVDIMRLLLSHNGEINSRTNSKLGISPLMLASMNGHLEAVTLLLDSGSDINAQIETNRNTALTLACFQGRTEVVSLLVDKKAFIEHRAKSGLTPLMEAASQGHVEVGRILIEAGADVNAPPVPASRETALIIAAEKGHTDFVKLLLQHNAIVDARNKKGDTPLWLASHGGYIEVVKILIEAMSDVNSADNRRMTCLMTAFKKGHVKVVKELVKYVTQFPSEHDCLKHMKSIKNEDKDLIKRCDACKEIILKAKEKQEYEAAKNAKDLLKQVEEERKAKEQKEVKQAKKREKKKAKKKAKHEDKDVEITKCDVRKEEIIVLVSPKKEVVTFSPPDLRSSNNNENINPENCKKNNKRSRAKQELEKNKPRAVEEIKCDNVIKKEEEEEEVQPISFIDSESSTNRIALSTSNEIAKNNVKTNSWVQINTTNSKESNNWQKIGGGKKKLDIQVNKKDIGKVIGQGGSVVNAIRHITGAHIDIDSMANELDERTVHLKGTLEAVSKAKDYICDLVEGNCTGSAVIKESEPFINKAVAVAAQKSCQIENIDFTPSKPLPIASRQSSNSKFGYTKSLTNNNNSIGNNNLQYGFSKSSILKAPDFATVAAAGIVSVSSPLPAIGAVQRSVKYSDTSNRMSSTIIDNFPSLSEANLESSQIYQHSPQQQQQQQIINNHNKEPLEVNTNINSQSSSSNQISKSFPLAPGSERSLHQRTYNSTPEHSPQIENNNNNTSSDSIISDKDDDNRCNNQPISNYQQPQLSNNNNNNNNWSEQPPQQLLDNYEMMNRFPKLQSLNPKAEAFSPSFTSLINNNNNAHNIIYNKQDEPIYCNINGTLTLNPTANIFKPRLNNIDLKYQSNIINYQQQQQQQQEERRLIRLQDHINTAIAIFMRTNGFDQQMAEAAFSSFMRSANLDLNTRLTTAEFTSLINNIINQSTAPPPAAAACSQQSSSTSSTPPPPPPPPSHSQQQQQQQSIIINNYDDNNQINKLLSSSSNISNQNQSNYRLINHNSPTTAQVVSHWSLPPPPPPAAAAPAQQTMITNLNSQSIWAPGSITHHNPLNPLNHHHHPIINNNNQQQQQQQQSSQFFPSLSQCVSAQAAFNSSSTFNNIDSTIQQQQQQQINNNNNNSPVANKCDHSSNQ